MRFVSLYAKFAFNVRGESMRWVRDSAGNERQIGNGDGVYVQFKPSGLSPEEQQNAVEIFERRNPLHPFGAAPKMHDDVISAQEAMSEGEAHNAHDGFLPWQRLGVLDTEDPMQVRPDVRELVEKSLLGADEFGIDLFRIDDYGLTAPWPTYPSAQTASVQGIIDYAKQGGFDFRRIYNYEKATTQRAGLLAKLEELALAQELQRDEEKALQVG